MSEVSAVSDIRISVVLPTFERADLLRRPLLALLQQTLDPAEYELIVVDNGSTDETAELVQAFAARDPRVRYVFEPRQGVSNAKNAGIAVARGEFVAFTDDDGVACRDWLQALLAAFDGVRPAPHVAGGPSLPLFAERRPFWYRPAYDARTWGAAPRLLEPGECFYGMNVAVRRDLLLRVGGFDPGLGMKGHALGFHEEPDLFERLRKEVDDLRACCVPEAVVHHFIPASRTSPGYHLKRAFSAGQHRHIQERLRARDAGRPGFAGKRLAWEGARLLWYLAWAGVALPRSRHVGNWVITWAVPVASITGYLAASAGMHVEVKRDH